MQQFKDFYDSKIKVLEKKIKKLESEADEKDQLYGSISKKEILDHLKAHYQNQCAYLKIHNAICSKLF